MLFRSTSVAPVAPDGAPAPSLGPAGDEPSLGAFARVIHLGPVDLVLLEPSTEGRLAAALARRPEGIVVLYVEGDPGPAARPTALGRPGRLLPHGKPWGPFVIVVAPVAADGG